MDGPLHPVIGFDVNDGLWSFYIECTKLQLIFQMYLQLFFCILKTDIAWCLQKLGILLENKVRGSPTFVINDSDSEQLS